MFEGFKRFWKGFMQMFGYTTLKQIVGKDITLSDKMIDAINEWKQMLNGQADWITDSIVSLGIEEGICREFADCALVEMETSLSNERLDRIYQKNISNLNENIQEGLALGSFVLKPLGEAAAEFVSADKIIPISFGDDGKPNDIAFLTVKKVGDEVQDYIFSHAIKYGTGNAVITDYVYFNILNGKGEKGKVSIIINSDGGGNAGETSAIDVEFKKVGSTPSEWSYQQD